MKISKESISKLNKTLDSMPINSKRTSAFGLNKLILDEANRKRTKKENAEFWKMLKEYSKRKNQTK